MTTSELTALLAQRVMRWTVAPGRFLMENRRWKPAWRFQPTKKLEDAFRLLDAADEGAAEIPPPEDEAAYLNGQRFRRRADLGESAVSFQQDEAGVDVVPRGHGVKYEMEAAGLLLHFFFVPRIDDFVGAEPQGVLHLARRSGENHDARAECFRELHPHVPQPPESHDADFLAWANFVTAQR